MKTLYDIRPAVPDDIPQIAAVHIQSWKETYPGIMPDKKIASLNMESSQQNWTNALSSGPRVFVATVDEQVIGFVSGGANRQNTGCETGLGDECECELAAIYLIKAYHRKGIGKSLFERFVREMQAENYQTMVVWVAEKNLSTGFYIRMGGEIIDRKMLQVCEMHIHVIAYRYIL